MVLLKPGFHLRHKGQTKTKEYTEEGNEATETSINMSISTATCQKQ